MPSKMTPIKYALSSSTYTLLTLFTAVQAAHSSNKEDCYGRLAVVSNVDGGGFALNVNNEWRDLLCYNEASTTERCWDQGGQDAHKVDECTE
jgi:hypothetical protein